MQDFTKLDVWRRALALAIDVDRLTRRFPRGGYGWLSAQARRSAASVGANIAEGCGQRSAREFARFLQIAAASASETQHHLALARGVGLLPPQDEARLSDELAQLRRMLVALRNRLNESLTTDDSKPTADSSPLR
jgi:four helix bundle protein